MRIVTCLVAVALCAASDASAQTTTADGVQALIRGDYQTAARILKPLADDASRPDALAQFFMATLYDSGQGVARDSIRACGLYLSAATAANPFVNQSLDLARFIQLESGPALAELCISASTSPSRNVPSASFKLGADHWVTIDQAGATVGYQGAQTHTTMIFGPGLVFVPIGLTQLDVTRPVDARRHFIELFIWQPDKSSDPPAWTLGWILNEIVGPAFLPVTGDKALLTLTGPQPPTSFDVHGAAHVRVNANGEAEWVVSGGSNPRSGVISFKGPR